MAVHPVFVEEVSSITIEGLSRWHEYSLWDSRASMKGGREEGHHKIHQLKAIQYHYIVNTVNLESTKINNIGRMAILRYGWISQALHDSTIPNSNGDNSG